VVAYPDGADSARVAPETVASLLGLGPVEVLLGWTPAPRPWLVSPTVRGRTVMAGYSLGPAVAGGRLRYLPVRLSAVPELVDRRPPDVAVVTGIRRGADLAFRGTVGWGPAAARAVARVVVEVDDHAPDLGAPLIPGSIAEVVPRPDGEDAAAPRPPDAVDLAVGRHVVSVFPEEPTLQLGPGAIAESIVAAVDRPVRIHSGLLTDAMARLADVGLLVGEVRAGYVWGGEPITALARAGRLRLLPVEQTHDITALSTIPRLVACNTALQLGLDGSVNVERVGGRVVAGIGGHADFCAGASRSPGGASVIALRSTDRRGASTIVPRVEVVSTPRCDVDVVVTEHGIADLRDADDGERARRLVAIAAPEHRDALAGWRAEEGT
jgi:acyl-CoA hydrolase